MTDPSVLRGLTPEQERIAKRMLAIGRIEMSIHTSEDYLAAAGEVLRIALLRALEARST